MARKFCNVQTIQKLLALGDEKISPFTIPSLALHSSSFLVLFTLAYGIATPGGIFMPSIMVSVIFFSKNICTWDTFFGDTSFACNVKVKRKLCSFWHMLPWNNTDFLRFWCKLCQGFHNGIRKISAFESDPEQQSSTDVISYLQEVWNVPNMVHLTVNMILLSLNTIFYYIRILKWWNTSLMVVHTSYEEK